MISAILFVALAYVLPVWLLIRMNNEKPND